jgi:hypothetical protein
LRAKTDEAIEEIERFLAHAKPVPLTDQVRLNPKKLRALVDQLREALAAERRE